jgi:hypothetical protein
VPEALVESKNPPERPKLPATVSVRDGVEDPIPIFPFASIVKSVVPVEEATVNGLSVEVP